MAVEVIDCLAAVGFAVNHEAGAFFGAAIAFRKLLGPEKQPSQEGRVLCIHFHNVPDMLFWNHQEMYRRLGVHIMEGQKFLILVNFLGGNIAFYYFTENAIAHDLII